MIYTSEQYTRDKLAMLGEFNKAIADAAGRCNRATPVPAGPETAEESRMAIDARQLADNRRLARKE